MPFLQQLAEFNFINDSSRDFFDDLPEEPLLESDNYFSNTYSFNNGLNPEQTPSLMGNDIFDNFNYALADVPTLESQSPYSGRNFSNVSSESDFSRDSMTTLSLPLKLGNISPFSSVASSPTPVSKTDNLFKIQFKMDDDTQDLLFGNDTPVQQAQQLNDSVNNDIILRSPFQDSRSKHNLTPTPQPIELGDTKDTVDTEKKWSRLNKVKRIRRSSTATKNVSKLQHPKTGKKIADSRLSVAALAEVLNLKSAHEALAIEKYILDIFEHELHYPLGYQTWIRDTPKDERAHLISQLYEKTKEKYPAYDKSILETIIRRSTYAMMQSRLRKERKKSRQLSKSSISSGNSTEIKI
ncbi:hypothetical protein MOUN0_J02256 [Monosporozyma unispora]|nr:hypothetical protein C6P44_005440 [Kazachstania unispora]